jgi:glycine/D-amino acid oxidase-like deaminating enzyme
MGGGASADYDVAIVGGGFYGCCIALFMRSLYDRVVVLERSGALLGRASAVNQARIHNGFHYPRSFVTALRSGQNFEAFTSLFRDAVVDDFDMLYAIARHGSKVSAKRFHRMFEQMGAPIGIASPRHQAIFDGDHIEAVFSCREHAFDFTALRAILGDRMARADIEVRHDCEVSAIADISPQGSSRLRLELCGAQEVNAGTVFNATYSQLNPVLAASGLAPLSLKHEWAEVALIEPAADMKGIGVTVMDGPFFSTMPFPSEGLYSLTHVRYTPHYGWVDGDGVPPASAMVETLPRRSRWYHMAADARRYMPCLGEAKWRKSLYEVKTVLTQNEGDDGRPILFHRHPTRGRFFSVLGGKIDNIFDLFTAVAETEPEWRGAEMRFLAGR